MGLGVETIVTMAIAFLHGSYNKNEFIFAQKTPHFCGAEKFYDD